MNNYIKCPLNYVGGKTKLLPQIIPYFPKNIDTFVDLFGGGFNVGINIEAKKHIYNEFMHQVADLISMFKSETFENIDLFLQTLIDNLNLSKTNQEGYLEVRKYYNSSKEKDSKLLFLLICYAFNNQIRFNSKGEYNMPFGKDRSQYTQNMRKNLELFSNKIKTLNLDINSFDFRKLLELKYDLLSENDFLYADPPYLISTAVYNGKTSTDGWGIEEEKSLLEWLDKLNSKNIKWALSNVMENNGQSNDILKEWAKKYTTIHLNYGYGNCNYHRANKNDKSDEVLVINYEVNNDSDV